MSGSVGLGHVGRDIAVANALRALKPGIEIEWMAGDPARMALRAKGEVVIPESGDFDQGTGDVETGSKDYHLDLLEFGQPFRDSKATARKSGASWPKEDMTL